MRESLPSIDANTFFEKFSVLSTEISEYDSSIAAAQQQLGRLEEEKLTLNKTTDALRAQIQAADKNKMSYRFTSRISSMMDNLITDVVRGKFQQIEQLTLYHTIIQDKTAHEYLLSNEAATGHTTVRPGYFAKEGSL